MESLTKNKKKIKHSVCNQSNIWTVKIELHPMNSRLIFYMGTESSLNKKNKHFYNQ